MEENKDMEAGKMILTARELRHAQDRARIQCRQVYCQVRSLGLPLRVQGVYRDYLWAGVTGRKVKISDVSGYYIA